MIIALLTDFGLEDGFVAACHGVIGRVAPEVRVLDVTHLVPPGDVRRGAALLAQVIRYLPDAVVVGVVDPGVGTDRRAVAVEAGRYVLVGPDNGLLPWAADAVGGPDRAWEITNRRLMLDPVSRTFHGRDVFSPVAAHLAAGIPVAEVGPSVPVASLARLPDPVCRVGDGWAEAEVLTVDRYGNLQTVLAADRLAAAGLLAGAEVGVRSGEVTAPSRYGETFGSAEVGRLVLYEDSAGLAALAVNGSSAATLLRANPGTVIRLTAARRPGG